MAQFDMVLLDRIAFAARKCPERAADIVQCFKLNQMISKQMVVQELPRDTETNICVLGGWYGIGFMLQYNPKLRYTIVDIDPTCKVVGNMINFPNFTHITADATLFDTSEFDYIINCSSEHIDKRQLGDSFEKVKSNTTYIIQNNNNYDVDDHINCFGTCEQFVDYLSDFFAIVKSTTTPMDNGTERYTVVCKKM